MTGRAEAERALRSHFAAACPPPFSLEPAGGPGVNSRNWIVRAGAAAFVLKQGGEDRIAPFYPDLAARSPLLPALVAQARDGAGAWRLLEFRPGAPDAARAAEAGRALAELQRALRAVPGAAPFSPRYAASPPAPPDIPELPAWRAGVAALEALGLPRGWVHHDFHPGNVLFQGAGVSAVLDMDSLGTDFRMQAVAFGASRFADPRAFLAAYDAADPLEPREKASYAGFVRREAVRRINWILGDAGGAWRDDLPRQLAIARGAHGA